MVGILGFITSLPGSHSRDKDWIEIPWVLTSGIRCTNWIMSSLAAFWLLERSADEETLENEPLSRKCLRSAKQHSSTWNSSLDVVVLIPQFGQSYFYRRQNQQTKCMFLIWKRKRALFVAIYYGKAQHINAPMKLLSAMLTSSSMATHAQGQLQIPIVP